MKPLKQFSQNFLIDPHIITQIIAAIDPQKTQTFLEIGPGKGALTEHIAPKALKLIAVEIDKRLAHYLEQELSYPNLHIICKDIQQIQINALTAQKIRVVGNLPYHLSTIIIKKLINEKHIIKDIHIMLQKEFAQRLYATPGQKNWSRLSILFQNHMQAIPLIHVDAKKFQPAPKVHSTVLQINPRPKPLFHIEHIKQFDQLLAKAFSKRRKTLKNALETTSIKTFETLQINPEARPETLTIQQWYDLHTLIIKHTPHT